MGVMSEIKDRVVGHTRSVSLTHSTPGKRSLHGCCLSRMLSCLLLFMLFRFALSGALCRSSGGGITYTIICGVVGFAATIVGSSVYLTMGFVFLVCV